MPGKKRADCPDKYENKYENALTYQSNKIIEGCRDANVTVSGIRMFYLMLLHINPQLTEGKGDTQFQIVELPIGEIVQVLGSKQYYNTLKKETSKIMKYGITIEDPAAETGFRHINIFGMMEYDAKRGTLQVRFNQEIMPYVLQLKGQSYTKIAAKDIFALKSYYAVRLLELLLEWQNINKFRTSGVIERTITVEHLRMFLGIPKDKYKRQCDFIFNVLKKPQEEINENPEYHFEYRVNTEGRKNVSYTLFLTVKKGNKLIETIDEVKEESRKIKNENNAKKIAKSDIPNADIISQMVHYGVGPIIAKRMAKEYARERIVKNLEYSKKQHGIKNLGAYIRRAIMENYAENKVPPVIDLFEKNSAEKKPETNLQVIEREDIYTKPQSISADTIESDDTIAPEAEVVSETVSTVEDKPEYTSQKTMSLAEDIRELAKLRDDGLITEDMYTRKVTQLMFGE